MYGFEVNKILAAIFTALIIIFIVDFVGDKIVNIEKDDMKETAYIIKIPESDTSTAVSKAITDESITPVSALLITASFKNGEKLFKKCGTCHNYEKNSKSKVGPNLWNIINRPKGSVQGFAYSKDLAELGGNWLYEELGQFLYKPKQFISGTKMNFAGLKNVEDRADLILWLQQQSDNPVPLP